MDGVAGRKSKTGRPFFTRSRNGCVTCRERRVRCNESRPACLNCLVDKRVCNYGPLKLPLRDLRAQQKLLQPWQQSAGVLVPASRPMRSRFYPSQRSLSPMLIKQGLGSALDPFDTLAIKMPLKSKELFHYFFQAEEDSSVGPMSKTTDSSMFAFILQDASALRNTLLVAAIHYSWNVGNLNGYEPTFYFHKIETMRLVNLWLRRPNASKTKHCAKEVLTLFIIEFCTGNIAAAEAHLEGLLTILDTEEDKVGCASDADNGTDRELVNRYTILVCSLLFGCKSHLYGQSNLLEASPGSVDKSASLTAEPVIRHWETQKLGRANKKLEATGAFPYFFIQPPSSNQLRDIDAYEPIRRLRVITNTLVQGHADMLRRGFRVPSYKDLNSNCLVGVLEVFIDTHVSSLRATDMVAKPTNKQQQRHVTPWSGITAASTLYLYAVLDIWNDGDPISQRLLRRLLLILKEDIEKNEKRDPSHYENNCDVLLWKVFMGALSLTIAPVEPMMQDIYSWFCTRIRSWSQTNGVDQWLDAQAALSMIVWPDRYLGEKLAEELWNTSTRVDARLEDYPCPMP